MHALLRELQASMNPTTLEKQEGVWGTIKKAVGTAADVADTAVSSIPVVGTAYDAGVGAYKAGKAQYHAGRAFGKWATGDKKGAAVQAKKAAGAGVDALGRAAGVAASFAAPGAGGAAASLATKAVAKPLVKAAVSGAVKTGVKSLAKVGTTAAHKALNKKPGEKPAVPAVKPTVPLVPKKNKPVLGAPSASESVLFQSVRALVEFRSLVGLPVTQEQRQQLEAEEALDVES